MLEIYKWAWHEFFPLFATFVGLSLLAYINRLCLIALILLILALICLIIAILRISYHIRTAKSMDRDKNGSIRGKVKYDS